MASSSTSSIYKSFKYDVFLSFRGEDTRSNFIDHLYHALQQKSIHTYKDDERIKKGKSVGDELIRSIEESKFYIIVFSKNYASSSWCLDELVKIMECHRTTDHIAYPVFYDVEPWEVRKQRGAVAEAFAKHENDAAAEKWKEALKEAADLAGWELKKTADGHEAKFIQKVVEELSLELRSISFSIDEKLVGMESRIREVVSSLETGSDDVLMIGIKGMGGGGKTTLARAVFDHISFQFEGKSFIENVREVSNASLSGLKSLQNQVLSDVLNDRGISVSSVSEGKHTIKRHLRGKKVLVVLDDVDHIDQLEALAELDWFKKGSRIIVTTRDEQVLIAHHVKSIHGVNLLSDMEATSLFNRYAFGRKIPAQEYEELSRQVVRYAAGLPLTIKVLGSFLCGKDEPEWIDAIERLKTIPLTETLKKLELSYIGLEEDYKEIFLDVACILKGWQKDMVIKVLESCGFHARNGLKVLEQKSLITFNLHSKRGWINMHDHIEEMGRNIVRRSHLGKPHKHSRLWIDDEIEEILANDLGTKATQCIRFHSEKLHPHIDMKGLRKMKELRFLYVALGDCFRNSEFDNIAIPDIPNALRYLHVNKYPFRSLPETFKGNNLVALEMAGSSIIQLWEGGERKVLNKMRFLDLSCSMLSTLDLGITPNLETLNLEGCYDLVELQMSVGCLKLKFINLTHSRLRTLDLGLAPNLEVLILAECRDLVELQMPGRCLYLISIQITNSRLRTLDIGLTPNLESLDLENCSYMEELHMADVCQKLTNLDITHSMLRTFDLRLTPNLKALDLSYCFKLVELQMPGRCLYLRSLQLTDSRLRTLDIGLTPNLENLDLENCRYLEELHMVYVCEKLANLNISHSKLRTLNLGLTPNLKRLDAKECCNFVEIHTPIGCLEKLVHLDLSGCLRFRYFLFDIKDYVYTSGYKSHEEVFQWESSLSKKVKESHKAHPVATLHLIVKSVERCPLHPDNNLPKFRFDCFYEENRPSMTRNLEILFSLGMCPCTNLETFSRSLCGLQRIRKLELEGNILQVLKDLDQLKCLEELTLSSTIINHLPDSIFMLKHLKYLNLNLCVLLEILPENLGRLECLYELDLSYTKIKHLPDSICMLKNLRILKLNYLFIEKLPEDLGRLKSLKELDLSYTKIKYLPDSICMLKNLRILKLNYLFIEKLPEDLGRLKRLEELDLSNTKIKHLPDAICMLRHLSFLKLNYLFIEKLPNDLGRLEHLVELDLSNTKIKHLPNSICVQKSLILKSCCFLEKLPEDLGSLSWLKELTLSCTMIDHLPDSICLLKHLKSLELDHCWLLEKLPEDLGQLYCLEKLDLSYTKIEHLSDSICMLKDLKSLNLRFCCFLEMLPKDLGGLECLEDLALSSTMIRHLPDSICMLKHLKSLELDHCLWLEKLPEDLGRLERLEKLSLNKCEFLQDIPNSIGKMMCLKYLHLPYCIRVEKLPEELGRVGCLKELDIKGTNISHLPRSILLLKDLCIIASKELLQSCGFTSEIQTLGCEMSSYIVIGRF